MAFALAKDRQPQTKQMFVYHTLRNAIMRCELPPGQRLVTDAIARQLSVSHIPVREALQLLQAEGLVENIAHGASGIASGATSSPACLSIASSNPNRSTTPFWRPCSAATPWSWNS